MMSRMCRAIRQRHVPLALGIEWEHGGRAAWDASVDVGELLTVLAYTNRCAAVAGAAVCVRTVLGVVLGESESEVGRHLLRAIEAAERWAIEPTLENASAADKAAESAADVCERLLPDEDPRRMVARAVVSIADMPRAADAEDVEYKTGSVLIDVLAWYPFRLRRVDDAVARRELAGVVRTAAACPTLDEIARAAAR